AGGRMDALRSGVPHRQRGPRPLPGPDLQPGRHTVGQRRPGGHGSSTFASVTSNWTPTRRGLIVAGSATVAGASAFALAACSPTADQPTTPDSQLEGLQPGTELATLADIPV